MNYNLAVSNNIQQLNELADQAKTQQELIEVIHTVRDHPGPLDYNNRWLYVTAAVMFYFLMVSLIHYHVIESANDFPDNPFGHMLLLVALAVKAGVKVLPASVGLALAWWAEKRSVILPLPEPFNVAAVRIGLITLFVTALLYAIPGAYQGYWSLFKGMLYLSSGGDRIYIHYAISTPLLLAPLGVFGWGYYRQNWRERLSDKIHKMDTLFNNGLTEISINSSEKTKQLMQQFRLFNRGSTSRSIKALYSGHYQGEVHNFDFEVFMFEFDQKRTRTRTNANGESEVDEEYVTHYRQGVMLDFPWIKSVQVNGDVSLKSKGDLYTTESIDFNKIYKVTTKDQMAVARLLTPAMIELLIEFKDQQRLPVLEFNEDGRLCVAFEGQRLLSVKRHGSLRSPDEFAKEISGHAELKQLDTLKATLHRIMCLCDNNFSAN